MNKIQNKINFCIMKKRDENYNVSYYVLKQIKGFTKTNQIRDELEIVLYCLYKINVLLFMFSNKEV